MTYKRKSWREKLADKKDLPKVLILEENFPCYKAVHKMGVEAGEKIVLVNPFEVMELMGKVPEGKLTTIVEICRRIAKSHGVAGCCTLTTGIFIMTVANAVREAQDEGGTMEVPYWRTLKSDGYLNEKYPGGAAAHGELLEREGFAILRKGKKHRVENHEDYLFRFE